MSCSPAAELIGAFPAAGMLIDRLPIYYKQRDGKPLCLGLMLLCLLHLGLPSFILSSVQAGCLVQP